MSNERDEKIVIVDLETYEPEHAVPKLRATRSASTVSNGVTVPSTDDCTFRKTIPAREARLATTLLVSASNQLSRGPVMLRLQSLNLSGDLFDMLFTECSIHPESVQMALDMTATFTFNGRKQRIRRHKPEDLEIFYSTIQKPWQKTPDAFSEVFEIEILIHVDD